MAREITKWAVDETRLSAPATARSGEKLKLDGNTAFILNNNHGTAHDTTHHFHFMRL